MSKSIKRWCLTFVLVNVVLNPAHMFESVMHVLAVTSGLLCQFACSRTAINLIIMWLCKLSPLWSKAFLWTQVKNKLFHCSAISLAGPTLNGWNVDNSSSSFFKPHNQQMQCLQQKSWLSLLIWIADNAWWTVVGTGLLPWELSSVCWWSGHSRELNDTKTHSQSGTEKRRFC